MLKQYCLEGILAKESSPRTKDFPLWSDLQTCKSLHSKTSLLELPTRVSQLWPVTAIKCGDPTWKDPNFGSPKIAPKADSTTYMSKLNISKNSKFGSFHLGSPHLMAVTGCNGLILANNFKTEVCSSSSNNISKACWQKKVLPEVIFKTFYDELIGNYTSSSKFG